MKTAEEWELIFSRLPMLRDSNVCIVQGSDIPKIQADALRHAADLVMADYALGGNDSAVRGSVKFLRKYALSLENGSVKPPRQPET